MSAATNVEKGSSLCPIGASVMGGAMGGGSGVELQPVVLADGRVVPPSPARQAANLANLDIYNFDPTLPNSDDEPLSDIE